MSDLIEALSRSENLKKHLDSIYELIYNQSYEHAATCILLKRPTSMVFSHFDDLNRLCTDVAIMLDEKLTPMAYERLNYLTKIIEVTRKSFIEMSYDHADYCVKMGKPGHMSMFGFSDLDRICRELINCVKSRI